MNLSNHDLPFFFDDSHQQLVDGLLRTQDAIAWTEHESPTSERDTRVARQLGRMGYYRWLLPALDLGPDGDASDAVLIEPLPVPSVYTVDVRSLCLIREFLGYVSPLADSIFAVQGLGSYPILLSAAGRPPDDTASEGWSQILSACASGRSIGAFGLTEPEAGSDVASMQTTAEPLSRGSKRYRLNGQKTLISNVGVATHYVVFANAKPTAGRNGISAFLVHAGSDGLDERPMELNIEHPIGALHLQDCRGTLLGEVGDGFKLAMKTLDTFRVTVGAAAVGMARRALDAAVEHVKSREQFGKPLAAHQLVQALLADMATELDAARLLVYRAAYAKDLATQNQRADETRSELGKLAAMAKLYATEAAQRIIDGAVQLFGGRGVVAGEVVESLYRAIRPLRIYEGTSEIQRIIIGRVLTS